MSYSVPQDQLLSMATNRNLVSQILCIIAIIIIIRARLYNMACNDVKIKIIDFAICMNAVAM